MQTKNRKLNKEELELWKLVTRKDKVIGKYTNTVEENKALQLTRHYTKGINQSIKYGNNDLKSNECHDNSNRYYHHTGSYLERKKQRILNKEKENTFNSVADCKLAQQCLDPHEKYYEIHGFNRSEPAVDPKCKC